jgi:hypothetical protein
VSCRTVNESLDYRKDLGCDRSLIERARPDDLSVQGFSRFWSTVSPAATEKAEVEPHHTSEAEFNGDSTLRKPIRFLVCLLPSHLVRILIFSNSEKHCLSQPIIPGPFREFDLADHRRFYQRQRFISAAVNPWSQRFRPGAGRLEKGQLSTRIFCKSSNSEHRSFSLNPVPTLPANFKFLPS